jgi:hypothetical protein
MSTWKRPGAWRVGWLFPPALDRLAQSLASEKATTHDFFSSLDIVSEDGNSAAMVLKDFRRA